MSSASLDCHSMLSWQDSYYCHCLMEEKLTLGEMIDFGPQNQLVVYLGLGPQFPKSTSEELESNLYF